MLSYKGIIRTPYAGGGRTDIAAYRFPSIAEVECIVGFWGGARQLTAGRGESHRIILKSAGELHVTAQQGVQIELVL
jgi:hypothetical protein